MKRIVLIVVAVLFIAGCVTTQPKPVDIPTQAKQEQLTRADVANILMLAINDIEKQKCTAEFLSERGGYIWCRCKNQMKYYGLEPLIEKYREGKQKAMKDKIGGN